jgi:hypothetical protein
MTRGLIIANDREIDIATSERAERWAVYGWRVALDCRGDDSHTIREKAHAYARQQGKRCRVPPVLSDQEIARRLNQIYRVLLGDDYFDAVTKLYMLDPQAAVKELQKGLDRISKPARELALVPD